MNKERRWQGRACPLYIVLALVPIAVGFRYLLEEIQATRLIGIKFASPDFLQFNKNGFQDAVSIPASGKWFFILLALLICGLAWLAVGFGWLWAFAGLSAAVLSSTFAQVLLLPKRDSRHFLLRVLGSMCRRHADFERDGDEYRAKGMRYLLERVAQEYGSVLSGDGAQSEATERIISKSE